MDYTWNTLTPANDNPKGRYGHAAIAYHKKIYIYGGESKILMESNSKH